MREVGVELHRDPDKMRLGLVQHVQFKETLLVPDGFQMPFGLPAVGFVFHKRCGPHDEKNNSSECLR
jgi:hypothetical protein